ncbi:MAG: hypothetical protein Q7S33_02860 [Nanoarchaeota archaeon]|nr:hypothetical protein [Nanoarchaeota archaeon]
MEVKIIQGFVIYESPTEYSLVRTHKYLLNLRELDDKREFLKNNVPDALKLKKDHLYK